MFDLDDTLAGTAHRQRYPGRGPCDRDASFAAAPEDAPLAEGVAPVHESARECGIVYLTGRPERCRRDTLDRLAAQGLPEGPLHLRGDADRRPARYTKPAIPRRLARTREIRVLVDDGEPVCADARRAGFTVVHARWTAPSRELKAAQQREGRT
ncbi:hypothetical protein SAMN05216505_106343 [Streptomyces prasinopilosus]|uniref:Polynucleotide kinase PNKP phosphatase domain-containing protein n=1 Tax=Streptomyces prasinopilosus TaxID=67344 RepID=A0A1G6TW03_9ACTN|nr:hypothetical protein [Streptomyces prasinopilosus]SDD32547.1 hypothetical protein SAMN05216505_106343 [Streptomyces prasinopilosus]